MLNGHTVHTCLDPRRQDVEGNSKRLQGKRLWSHTTEAELGGDDAQHRPKGETSERMRITTVGTRTGANGTDPFGRLTHDPDRMEAMSRHRAGFCAPHGGRYLLIRMSPSEGGEREIQGGHSLCD